MENKEDFKFGYKNMIDIPAKYDLRFCEMNILYDLKDIWKIMFHTYRLGFNRGIRYQSKKKKKHLKKLVSDQAK